MHPKIPKKLPTTTALHYNIYINVPHKYLSMYKLTAYIADVIGFLPLPFIYLWGWNENEVTHS